MAELALKHDGHFASTFMMLLESCFKLLALLTKVRSLRKLRPQNVDYTERKPHPTVPLSAGCISLQGNRVALVFTAPNVTAK